MVSKLARLALPTVVALVLPWLASAQPAKPQAQPSKPAVAAQALQAPAAEGAYRPPVVQFDPKGLSLLDAVRLTLVNDPNVKLRDTDVERQLGVFREQRGFFDLTLKGKGDFQYVRSELRDTDKRNEQFKRDQLDDGIAQGQKLLASLNPAVTNLNNPKLVTDPKSVDLQANVSDTDVKTELSMIQSQLFLIKDMLDKTTDPTTRKDLTDLRDKTISNGLQRFNAARDATNKAVADTIVLRRNLGATPQDRFDRSSNVRLDFTRPTRSGLVLNPFVTLNYTAANYVGKDSWDPNFGGLGVKDFYKGEIGFDLTVPLLRGLGKDDSGATEMAAARDLESVRWTLVNEKARSVLNTALAYWEARAATELVDVAKRSVDMQSQMADLVKRLVAAQEKARTDETRVTASLADSQARLESANRRLAEARVNLARVIGVAVGDAGSIPLAGDPFPRPGAFTVDAASLAELTKAAIAGRPDQMAFVKTEEGSRILSRGAKLETRRQLNLNLSGWGNSTSEDSPKFGRWVFRSGSVGLDFEVPFANNTALGRYDQAMAALHQDSINTADSSRTIALSVYRVAESLRLAAERVKWAEEAALAYEKTIQDEQARMKMGDSTLIDTILTEQQTTAARTAFVQALQDYASLLARLRYESGTLIRDVNGQTSVALENLLTVPLSLQKTSPAR
ncbi:MAG TPA: TolC family protein [Vicinamibacterales bacterium]|jgi:outer membrane protein TolC